MDFIHRSSPTSVPRCPWLFRVAGASVVAVSLMLSPLGLAHASERTPPSGGVITSIAGVPLSRVVAPASLFEALAAIHKHVPAYSRQTGLACSSCHYQFPQLTPFGRLFKLNGYTMTGLQTIEGRTDSTTESLKLAPI